MSYVVATVTTGQLRMEFEESIEALRATYSYRMMKPGMHYLDDARNACVERFLKDGDEDWLLFIDDDQSSFNTDMVKILLESGSGEHRCVCGWYLSTLNNGIGPVVFQWGPHPQFGEHYLQIPTSEIHNRPRDDYGYIPVSCAGTGFMGLHRSLLEELVAAYPYPTTPFAEEVINGVHCGEDMTICHRIHELGYKVYVHPDIHVGHIKTVELREQREEV